MATAVAERPGLETKVGNGFSKQSKANPIRVYYNTKFIKYSDQYCDRTEIITSTGKIILKYIGDKVFFKKYNLMDQQTYYGFRRDASGFSAEAILIKREEEIVNRAKELEEKANQVGEEQVIRELYLALYRELERQGNERRMNEKEREFNRYIANVEIGEDLN